MGHLKNRLSRRAVLKSGIVAGVAATATASRASDYLPKLTPTPTEIKGPFYPIVAQKDQDFDLTRVEGRLDPAAGDPIMIVGQVADTVGHAVSDATVELWQAAASGKYNHPHDPNPAPADPNFQGWAVVPSGEQGGFRFKTVMPGPYPAARGWVRPPHIHFKVSKRGYVELITQMYFPGHPLNEKDKLFLRKSRENRQLMTAQEMAQEMEGQLPTYRYRIVLQKA